MLPVPNLGSFFLIVIVVENNRQKEIKFLKKTNFSQLFLRSYLGRNVQFMPVSYTKRGMIHG